MSAKSAVRSTHDGRSREPLPGSPSSLDDPHRNESNAMKQSEQKVVQYLNEAHATEIGLVRVLQSQIAMTPRGSYRNSLEKHLGETRDTPSACRRRLGELGGGGNPLQAVGGFAETVVGQTLALGKTPFDLVRGSSGEEKVLKNAKDACATEALEIATYTAIERLARTVGDEQTAKLAASIRADEEKMLERIMRELPKLTAAVVGADIEDDPSYDVTKTGAADARARDRRGDRTRASAPPARPARCRRRAAEGRVKGAVGVAVDLRDRGYDKLTAEEIVAKLAELSQIDLAKVDSYERKHDNRTTSSSASASCAATSRGRATTSSPSPSSRPRSRRPTTTASSACAPTSAPTRPAPACSRPPSASSPASELTTPGRRLTNHGRPPGDPSTPRLPKHKTRRTE